LLNATLTRVGAPVKAGDQGPAAVDLGGVLGGLPELPPTARRLLEAGVWAFAEQGYHGTTTRDIATRAGLSPAGLYVHYPSKGALLAHLSELGHDAAAQLVATTLGPAGSAPATVRLHRSLAAFVAWNAEHHLVARVVQDELRSLDAPTRARIHLVRRSIEAQVEAVVAQGATAGEMVVDHHTHATRAVLSLAVNVARWYDPDGRQSPAELGQIYADLSLRMLGARTEAERPVTEEHP